jgi:hypothetical protein
MTSVFEEVASTHADEKIDDRLWSIDCNILKDALIKKMATEIEGPAISALSDFILDTVFVRLKNRIKKHEGRIYSLILWRLRFGNITEIIDSILRLNKKTNIIKNLLNIHPNKNQIFIKEMFIQF